MTTINLELPVGSAVYNRLYRATDPAYLTQDLLSARLPNGFMIDVGWFPEHDPNGAYILSVFDPWDEIIAEHSTRSVDEVKQWVEWLSSHYYRKTVNIPSSASMNDLKVYAA